MKKENLNVNNLNIKIDDYLAQKENIDEFIAKRKTTLKSWGRFEI